MKKLIKSFVVLILLINLALTAQMFFGNVASAAIDMSGVCAISPFSPACVLKNAGKDTKLPSFEETGGWDSGEIHANAPEKDPATPGVSTAISPIYYAIDIFRLAVSGITLLVMVIAGIQLITAHEDEALAKAKRTGIYAAIGLVVIQLASTIVKKMVFGESGDAFGVNEDGEPNIDAYKAESLAQIRGIVGFVEYVLAAVAVLVIIIRGFTLVASSGEQETMDKAKRHIMYAAAGLVIVAISEGIVQFVIFPNFGGTLPDVAKGTEYLATITNFLAGFIALASFLMLFYAGYLYVVLGWKDDTKEKVQKIIIGAVVGIIVALGAFAAINTFIQIPTTEIIDSSEVSTETEGTAQ